MFKPLLGKTMEVYIDDMLVKSKQRPNHVTQMQEAFELLKAYNMKLNPSKCAFGISIGQFLGFMVTQRGIEANAAQLKGILESPAPSSRKGVQQLIGRLAALRQFISRFTNYMNPFFATLKGVDRAGWNEESDQALVAIKHYLAESLVLASLEAGETLFMYLVVFVIAVSVVLFKEGEDGRQRPMLFVSKSLADAETRYNHLEQAALSLRTIAKKLCLYFQAHPIVVLTNLPLRSTIHKLDLSRRMAR